MRNILKKNLKLAFEAPRPTRKEAFLSNFDYPKASKLDFIKSQLGYIRKRIWILSILLFIGAIMGLNFYKMSTDIIWIVSFSLPFIFLISISEIFRSITYHMDELEMSCKHNFLEIMLIRLGILGIANLLILIGILLLFIGKTEFGVFKLGIYIIMPYLLNCYLSLFVVNYLKSREVTYICCGVTAFISIINVILKIEINDIYLEKYNGLWMIAFIILSVLSIVEIIKLIKRMEELQWNLQLTA